MRYQFILQHRECFSLAALCRVMQVRRSGFYAWRKRSLALALGEPPPRQKEDVELLQKIQTLFDRSRQTFGSPRILNAFRQTGVCCGKHRLLRLMRQAGIRAIQPRRFVATTDSKHSLPIAENLLDRKFEASRINVKWASDITYIWWSEGWLYLAVVMDLFSRRIVGWSMQETMDRSLVIQALDAAICFRKPDPVSGLLHHSDRGSQYASADFQEKLASSGIVCSMSRKGNCWDNAPVESFFGTLKQELVYRRHCSFPTRSVARQEVFEYIEVWYNRERSHSRLGYLSPMEFEQQSLTVSASVVCA